MSFTKHKYLFFGISFVGILGMLVATFTLHDGFARSITFNGGIRLSIIMPATQGKKELEAAVKKAGYNEFLVRQTDPRLNTYDLELGPDLRDAIEKELHDEHKKRQQKIRELQKEDKEVPPDLYHKKSVSDVITEKILPLLGIDEDQIVSKETIAASYGDKLGMLALKMMIFTLIAIGLYLTFRFDFPFALGASMALIHDVFMTIGFIGIMQVEPSIPVLAAVLTIVGYSINDTIVVFDRIRENIQDRQQATLGGTIDLAITQTLSRTVITSVSTLLAAMALFVGGESSLKDFAQVLIFGIVVGTYSSIFIAANTVQLYEGLRNRFRS